MKLLSRNRKLHIESLEDRQMLSVTTVADFEGLFDSYNPANSWNGDSALYDTPNTFTSGPCEFSNVCTYDYDWEYYSWGGFGYSQVTDNTTTGFGNQMSAFPGSGANNSETYGIGYCDTYSDVGTVLTITDGYAKNFEFLSLMVTNATYPALSIRDGDLYAEPFGMGDHFELLITGYDADGQQVGDEITVTLADYTGGKSFVLDTWLEVDISSLKDAVSLEFSMTTTDEGMYGPNTPFYFALDDVTLVAKDEMVVDFEDVGASLGQNSYWTGAEIDEDREDWGREIVYFASGPCEFVNSAAWWGDYWDGWTYSNMASTTTAGATNQFSVYPGHGANGSVTYAIAYDGASMAEMMGLDPLPIHLAMTDAYTNDYEFASMQITNTTYAVLSMQKGDGFAKKFAANDWFLLTITGYDADGNELSTSIDFYLADFRDADSNNWYIVEEWATVDLMALEGATSLGFVLTSSDVGDWGMNTPSYFAADNIVLKKKSETQEPVEPQPGDVLYVSAQDDIDDGIYTSGKLSLREAVKLTGLWAETDTIRFADTLADKTITLTGGEIKIKSDVTISGSGITINAANQSHIFNIAGTLRNMINVTIDGLTLTGGMSKTQGGAVYLQHANVAMTNVAINSGTALYGGAIYVASGSLTMSGGLFSGNTATYGGAIYLANGTLTMSGGLFSGNTATYGGAIYLANGTLTMSRTVVDDNTATWGGGIYQAKGSVELTNVTLSNNMSTWGGGFYQLAGNATLVDTTFSGNTAGHNYGSGVAKTAKAQLVVIKNGETVLETAMLQYIDENLL